MRPVLAPDYLELREKLSPLFGNLQVFSNPSANQKPTVPSSLPRGRTARRLHRYHRYQLTLHCLRKVCIRRFPGCPRELPHFYYTRRKIRLPGVIRRAKAHERTGNCSRAKAAGLVKLGSRACKLRPARPGPRFERNSLRRPERQIEKLAVRPRGTGAGGSV